MGERSFYGVAVYTPFGEVAHCGLTEGEARTLYSQVKPGLKKHIWFYDELEPVVIVESNYPVQ